MSDGSKRSPQRLLVGILIGGSLALIGIAVWMIATDQGSPVFVALAGSMLAVFAAILASQTKKTDGDR